MWVLSLLAGIVVICGITAVTGYFVAQEFAFMAVDRSRLAALEANGSEPARRALRVTGRTSFMLSGAQLGITVTGLLVGYVAEPLVGSAIGEALGGVGVPTGVGITVGTVLALFFSTIIQMVFGELFPKNLAIARPEPLALRLARSTLTYLATFGWLIHLFDAASNRFLRLIHIEPVHDVEHSATLRDLEHIVSDSQRSGDLPADLSMLIDRILDFPRQDVEHAMIPRARTDVVESDITVREVRTLMATGHSRYPVVDESGDAVAIVALTDLMAREDLADDDPVTTLLREPLYVATSMSLPDALRELSRTRNQLACVVDEYGGFAGVITVEDIAEELVGEISDEFDNPNDGWLGIQVDGNTWIMAGDVHLDEVERAVDRELPPGDYETLAGLAIAVHGSLPKVNTTIRVELPVEGEDLVLTELPQPDELELTVLTIERHVPARLRVTLIDNNQGDEEDSE